MRPAARQPKSVSVWLRLWLFVGAGGLVPVYLLSEHARRELVLLALALALGVLAAAAVPRLLSRRACRSLAAVLTAAWLLPVLVSGAVYAAGERSPWAAAPESGADRSALFAGKTVLILAPHPDDEINLAGGVIEEYVAAGSRVVVVFSTNGDGWLDGDTRCREAAAALAELGVPAEDVLLLGYGSGTAVGHTLLFDAEEPTVSFSGHSATHGQGGLAVWREGGPYTRENFTRDLEELLLSLRPDVVICCDNDPELEHRTLSLLFEQAMGRVLHETADYRPAVLRAMAYAAAWMGPDDYRSGFIGSSEGAELLAASSLRHTWERRLRLPVAGAAVSLLSPEMTSVGRALARHVSQDAVRRAPALVNGDKVFFPRRTDNLLYAASVETSSGDGGALADFILSDTDALVPLTNVLAKNVWAPEPSDEERTAVFTFPEAVTIAAVALWDSPDPGANVLSCRVDFDGGAALETGPLDPRGDAVALVLDEPVRTRRVAVTLLAGEGEGYGLAEMEAFAEPESAAFPFWKMTDGAGNYLYDVLLPPAGAETFFWAAHQPVSGAVSFAVDDPACSVSWDAGSFTVACPEGHSCVVTARGEDGGVLDTARFYHPRPLVRWGMEHFDFFTRHRGAYLFAFYRELFHKVQTATFYW